MTRVLVLGANGMLGHKLVQVLGERMATWGTVRTATATGAAAAVLDPERTLGDVRADDLASVATAMERSEATVVVNAIGIIKQADAATSAVPTIAVNALFPHQLAALCAARGARLIHVSTDCVFSGDSGGYTIDDVPDASDLYGRSKLLGEVGNGALTLRTSIVGRELSGALGLFEWFLTQRGGTTRGFTKAVFSGLTTAELATVIGDVIERHADLEGIWHLSADPIDKHTLLTGLRDALGADIELTPDDRLVIDRSLDSTPLRARLGWSPPSWPAMLEGLAADPTPYDTLRGTDAHE